MRKRRQIRLANYDYSQLGAYYVTICTYRREHVFGNVVNGKMVLNELGVIINQYWQKLPNRFPNIEVDTFVIMPNHFHGIINIVGPNIVGVGFPRPEKNMTNDNPE